MSRPRHSNTAHSTSSIAIHFLIARSSDSILPATEEIGRFQARRHWRSSTASVTLGARVCVATTQNHDSAVDERPSEERGMATQQERELFLRGWRAAMDEVLAVLESEAREWAAEEREASASGQYKLPGSFPLEELPGSFKGRHELLVWITQIGPAAARQGDPALLDALDAMIENRATNEERSALGLAAVPSTPAQVQPEAE